MLTVEMVSQVHTYGNIFQTVHFKHVQFIIWQLYLTKAVKIMQGDTEKIEIESVLGPRRQQQKRGC